MKALLEDLVDELNDLKRDGLDTVNISENTLTKLGRAVDEYVQANDIHLPEVQKEVSLPVKEDEKQVVKKPIIAKLPDPPKLLLPDGNKESQYAWFRDKVLECPVCKKNIKPEKKIVIGSGSLDADMFFCGDVPGVEEEDQGEVFVGESGQLLTKIIGAMGAKRTDVYLTNVMNWRPVEGYASRPPVREEMDFCLSYLNAQLSIVKPKVIVALGKVAVDALLGHDSSRKMGEIRGKWFEYAGIPLMITFHPSYLLHSNSMRTKRMVWEDMLMVMERVGLTITEKHRSFFMTK